MPIQVTRLRLFVASPGDVQDERDALRGVVDRLQRTLGKDRCALELVRYETHATPGMGDVQTLINEQLALDDIDIFVGILWKRFGTPTTRAGSGTEEEFRGAYASWQQTGRPPILFYFCQRPHMPTTRQENEQMGKVLDFRLELEGKGLIWPYTSLDEFKDLVFQHLYDTIKRILDAAAAATATDRPSTAPPTPPVDPDRARRQYLTALRRDCLSLPLGPLGSEGGTGEDVTLDQVYISLNTTTRLEHEGEEKHGSDRIAPHTEQDAPLLPAREAVSRHRSMVLLGEPGSGKSTFVRLLVAGQADALLHDAPPPAGLPPDLLPVLLTLRDLTPHLDGLDLADLPGHKRRHRLAACVEQHAVADLQRLNASDFSEPLRRALADGGCLLVLDGLDEVPQHLHSAARQVVSALLEGAHRVIVTCRVRSYVDREKLPLPDYTLAPFDEDQIKDFARAWYRAQHERHRCDAEQARTGSDDLAHAATAGPLLELARNPMLLTTMAVIHQKRYELPHQRVRLYRQAVELLVREWRFHKTGRAMMTHSEALTAFLFDDVRLWRTLERLAYEAHRSHREDVDRKEAVDLPRGAAVTLLEQPEFLGDLGLAGAFLDYVDQRAGLLVGRGGGEGYPVAYSFPHRTFQEYLAGCYLVGQRHIARAIRRHMAEGEAWALAVQLGAEQLYYVQGALGLNSLRDVIYDLGRTPVDDERGERAVLWAGSMAALVGRAALEEDREAGGAAFLREFVPVLAGRLGGALTPPERAEAGRALARLGDPREGITTLDALPCCLVPAGPFRMGSDRKKDKMAWNDEEPPHTIEIPYAYWISRYPITQAQYGAFVEAGGYRESSCWTEAGRQWKQKKDAEGPHSYGAPFDLPDHPVVGVSWYEALAFTRWLTARLRESGDLPEDWEVTLPSEAEWEKAARGGIQIVDAPVVASLSGAPAGKSAVGKLVANPAPERRFPWGDEPDPDRANYGETGIGTTSAVGCFPGGASPYSLEDLSGNVYEWTRSLWGEGVEPSFSYPYDAADGREDLNVSDRIRRVLRGGWFGCLDRRVRCAVRVRFNPYHHSSGAGFRVVLRPVGKLSAFSDQRSAKDASS